MQTTLNRLDVVYEVRFRRMSFELPRTLLPILERLHDQLQEKTLLNPSDIQVLNGASMADVGVRIRLFGGSGSIEVRPDGLKAIFERIRTPEDIDIVKNCLALAEEALQADISYDAEQTTIRLTTWFSVNGGRDAVLAQLQSRNEVYATSHSIWIGGTKIDFLPRAVAENIEEGWNLDFLMSPSPQPEGDLWCYFNYVFSRRDDRNGILSLSAHVESSVREVLSHFGFTLSESSRE